VCKITILFVPMVFLFYINGRFSRFVMSIKFNVYALSLFLDFFL
jgi:hypothetical protein